MLFSVGMERIVHGRAEGREVMGTGGMSLPVL